MRNIFILSTDEASRLYEIGGELTLSVANTKHKYNIGRNIYMTNEEEIKKGDYLECDGLVSKVKEVFNRDKYPYLMENSKEFSRSISKKIIITTDQILISDGVQELTEEQLEEIVSRYPLDYVKVKHVRKEYVDELDAYGYDVNYYSLFFNSFPAEKTEIIQETVEYFERHKPNNKELEESIRQIFKDETKNKLWSENGDNDCGFSEEYVFWLEQKLISYAKR